MSVTQDHSSNTQPPSPPKKKASRAEYARKRRAHCGEVFETLREIKALIEKLEGGAA